MDSKKIDFSYWLSFEFLTLSDVALLLANKNPIEASFEDFLSEYEKSIKLLSNAVQAGKILQAVNYCNRIVEDQFCTKSIVNFLLEIDFSNENEFRNHCKYKKLKDCLSDSESIRITYKDNSENITKRSVKIAKLIKEKVVVIDLSDEHKEKDFVISRILNISNEQNN